MNKKCNEPEVGKMDLSEIKQALAEEFARLRGKLEIGKASIVNPSEYIKTSDSKYIEVESRFFPYSETVSCTQNIKTTIIDEEVENEFIAYLIRDVFVTASLQTATGTVSITFDSLAPVNIALETFLSTQNDVMSRIMQWLRPGHKIKIDVTRTDATGNVTVTVHGRGYWTLGTLTKGPIAPSALSLLEAE